MLHLVRRFAIAFRPLPALLLALNTSVPATAIEPAPTDPTWSEYVSALLTPAEKALLESLEQQYERGEYVERFWAARDPDPSTPRNELREQWPQRLGTAESEFDGAASARGRAFLFSGPPQYLLSDLCQPLLWPLEIWFYPGFDDSAGTMARAFVFFQPDSQDFRLWNPESQELAELFREPPQTSNVAARRLVRECPRGGELSAILEQALPAADVFAAPRASDWIDSFRRDVLGVDRQPLECELTFEFPGSSRNLVIVDGTLSVRLPRGDDQTPGFILDGDIFRGEHRADSFRYRFEPPPNIAAGDPVGFAFRRHLAAGPYRLLLTVRTSDSRAIFNTEQTLQVPSPSTATADIRTEDPASLKIKPLPLGLLTGRQRVDVITSGSSIASVSFYLDERRVMKKSRPPFSVELDLGPKPRTHTLEVIGVDADGRELGRDVVPINTGPHRFAVRLVEPRVGHAYSSALSVHADVNVPPGDKLDRVELYFNEARLATIYQPPFVHPHLELPTSHATGYVRAVAILDDGNSADDLVVINTGGTVDQLQVDFVELYASAVDRKGNPVTGLNREDFTVFEDGTEQTISRFETVSDLPINAGIVIDTSISMIEELDEAEDAATRFFESVIQSKDRAAVVVFSDQPELRVPLTNSHSRLAAGLDGIEAGGETTLYDSVVFGLYYMVGLRGKRALILLTDGVDSQSSYSFDETLEFARFSGVAIYSIGIDIPRQDHEARRVLSQLALQTGGDSFFIDSARELTRIYGKIENELRSQYLIGYQSTQSGSEDFRRVEIRSRQPRVDVKAAPGYYP